MNEENKKQIKVKMRVVAFSDLPELKEVSFREVGVGNLKVKNPREKESKATISQEEIQKQLEIEGNESLF